MKISSINFNKYVAKTPNFKAYHTENEQDYNNNPQGMLCHTSMFFRYPKIDEKVVEILKNIFPNQKLKIISQGCSQGEEVYSIAMLLKKSNIEADLVGVDIDDNIIYKARKGAYELDFNEFLAFINPSGNQKYAGLFDEYFVPNRSSVLYPHATGKFYKKKKDKFQNCKFLQGDILNCDKQFPKNSVNAIFCRNILYHLLDFEDKNYNEKVCDDVIKKMKMNLVNNGIIIFAPSEIFSYNHAIEKALITNDFRCLDNDTKTIWQKMDYLSK